VFVLAELQETADVLKRCSVTEAHAATYMHLHMIAFIADNTYN